MYSTPPIRPIIDRDKEAKQKITAAEVSAEIRLWAQHVLPKLDYASDATVIDKKNAGFAWHKADTPNQSKVGVTFQMKDSRVSSVAIAGRPRPKHGGSHGQHTTAFSTNREVIASALIGRKEEECRESLWVLFKTLLDYPAFQEGDNEAVQDIQLFIQGVLEAIPKNEYTIPDLVKLYLEVREAIPGASLDTGITGKSTSAGRDNVVGKAESYVLADLRYCEEMILAEDKVSKSFSSVTVADYMLGLYDSSAEKTNELSYADILNMRQTFIMSIAQAFPACYTRDGVRAALVEKLMQNDEEIAFQKSIGKEPHDECFARLDAASNSILGTAVHLMTGNVSKVRPMPNSFTAELTEEGRIQFESRPVSIKDGGSVGDHTCSMQLMKNAATQLLAPHGPKTSVAQLRKGLQDTLDFINVDFLSFTNHDILKKSPDPDEDEVIDGSVLGPFGQKILASRKNVKDLRSMINNLDEIEARSIEKFGVDANHIMADAADIVDAAELYLKAVDERPTAVNHGGLGNGRGEPAALAVLAQMTKDTLKYREDHGPHKNMYAAQKVVDAFMGVFDPQAAVALMDNLSKDDEQRSLYMDRVIYELLFFAKNAYPELAQSLDGANQEKVIQYVKKAIGRGELSKDDEDYEEKKNSKSKKKDDEKMIVERKSHDRPGKKGKEFIYPE